ncbi:hypothetical protein [Amycolatopsis vastitatis]|uniref:hypothetical protein n=1 Tax=Amycolatopsis vastitatis TaxID=1905142 RepID=UPI001F0A1E5F|nr:hypothetical protein [Amycolatopsis vastitatis]
MRVVQQAVRADLHGVAHRKPLGEHDRAVVAQFQQPAVGGHLVDEHAVADAGDAVGQPHLTGDEGELGVGTPSPHPAGEQVGDVHRPVGVEREVVVKRLHWAVRRHDPLDSPEARSTALI